MSTVFTSSTKNSSTRKNRNESNALNSFYSLNPNIRMKKISYQADQITKLPIKAIPFKYTKSTSKSKSNSKSPTPLTHRAPLITTKNTTNTHFKKRIFSPTQATTTNNSFITIKVTKNKSPNRQFDLSTSHTTEILSNNNNNNTLTGGNYGTNFERQSKDKKPKIMLPYNSLNSTNVNHRKQQSLPYFHYQKIQAFTNISNKINNDIKHINDKSRSKSRSPLKNSTPTRNRLAQSNTLRQSSLRVQTSLPNYTNQTIESSNSTSFLSKKKTPFSISTSTSRSKGVKSRPKKIIHLSPSENHFTNTSSLTTIAVNKTKKNNKKEDNTLLTQKTRMHTQMQPSTITIPTSSNTSYNDLLLKVKVPDKTSRNSEFSSNTNISNNDNNDTISTKSNNCLFKTVHSIAKISQTGFAGFNKSKVNQDSLFIYSSEGNEYHFLGVCDGHGNKGHFVSSYLVNTIPMLLKKEMNEREAILSSSNNFHIHKLLENCFISANSKLSNESSIDTNFSGSTCISVLVSTDKIYCANVGDSRALLGKYYKNNNKWDCHPLSRDHKPSEYDEAKRIMRFNGRIEQYREDDGSYVGPLRVWLRNEAIPGLAMTRSFGDQIASSVGVICEPEIKDFSFKEEDKFIVLASDGLWEYVSNEECMEVVSHYYQHTKDAEGAVKELYKRAFRAWVENDPTIDDITIILVFFS